MAAGTQSPTEPKPEPDEPTSPEITICESCPGKSVFVESGNTDGWIASTLTVEPRQ